MSKSGQIVNMECLNIFIFQDFDTNIYHYNFENIVMNKNISNGKFGRGHKKSYHLKELKGDV